MTCNACAAGEMATVREANAAEPLRFWGGGAVQGRVVLGAAVRQACPGADDLATALSVYDGEAFAVTYRWASAKSPCPASGTAHGHGLCRCRAHSVFRSETDRALGADDTARRPGCGTPAHRTWQRALYHQAGIPREGPLLTEPMGLWCCLMPSSIRPRQVCTQRRL